MEKESIFDYITKEEYESKIKGLKDSETRNIYKSGNIEIDVKKWADTYINLLIFMAMKNSRIA